MGNTKLAALFNALARATAVTPTAQQVINNLSQLTEAAVAEKMRKEQEKKEAKAKRWGVIGDIASLGVSAIPGLGPSAKAGLDAAVRVGSNVAGGGNLEDALKDYVTDTAANAVAGTVANKLEAALKPDSKVVSPKQPVAQQSTEALTKALDRASGLGDTLADYIKHIPNAQTIPQPTVVPQVDTNVSQFAAPLNQGLQQLAVGPTRQPQQIPIPQELQPQQPQQQLTFSQKFFPELVRRLPSLIGTFTDKGTSSVKGYGLVRPEVLSDMARERFEKQRFAKETALAERRLGMEQQQLDLQRQQLGLQRAQAITDIAYKNEMLAQSAEQTRMANLREMVNTYAQLYGADKSADLSIRLENMRAENQRKLAEMEFNYNKILRSMPTPMTPMQRLEYNVALNKQAMLKRYEELLDKPSITFNDANEAIRLQNQIYGWHGEPGVVNALMTLATLRDKMDQDEYNMLSQRYMDIYQNLTHQKPSFLDQFLSGKMDQAIQPTTSVPSKGSIQKRQSSSGLGDMLVNYNKQVPNAQTTPQPTVTTIVPQVTPPPPIGTTFPLDENGNPIVAVPSKGKLQVLDLRSYSR